MNRERAVETYLQMWQSSPPRRLDRWAAQRPVLWGALFALAELVFLGAGLIIMTIRYGLNGLLAALWGGVIGTTILMARIQTRAAQNMAEALRRYEEQKGAR